MWGYLEYRGGYNECLGVILSTVGDVQYHGDIMSTLEVFSTVGENLLLCVIKVFQIYICFKISYDKKCENCDNLYLSIKVLPIFRLY